MPELPEVETVRRTLLPLIDGKTMESVLFLWEGVVANTSLAEMRTHLVGGRICGITRRGKYLALIIAERGYLVVHLRMTGRLMVRTSADPYERHLRALVQLSGESSLRFADQRKFGRFYWAEDDTALANIARVGPEPLADDFTAATLAAITARSNTNIKAVLLNQARLAGLGNIYADESLFRASIAPHRRASSLSELEVERLWQAIRAALTAALEKGGTTFRDYVDGSGRQGENQHYLLVYGKGGQPCPLCGCELLKERVAGRGTVYCPACQK